MKQLSSKAAAKYIPFVGGVADCIIELWFYSNSSKKDDQ